MVRKSILEVLQGYFSTQVKLLSQNQQSGRAMVMVDLGTLDNTDAEKEKS